MASFLNLPTFAQNGPGTAVDVSAMGAIKTVTVGRTGAVFQPFVTIEIACDAAALVWTPLKTFQSAGQQTFEVVCLWMRASVLNYKGGAAPNCDVGANAELVSAFNLPATAGNGVAAAVDVSTLGLLKTIQVGGAFRGQVNIEISEDGLDYETIASIQNPGAVTIAFSAEWMRVVRVGVPGVAAGLPVVNVAASSFGGGGGGGGVFVETDGSLIAPTPFNTFDFVGGIAATDAGGGVTQVALAAATITPPALPAGITNDYNPAGFAQCTRMRQATNAAGSALGGLVPSGVDGQEVDVVNLGPGPLTLIDEEATEATVGRRFALEGGVNREIGVDGVVAVQYDLTSARWRSKG